MYFLIEIINDGNLHRALMLSYNLAQPRNNLRVITSVSQEYIQPRNNLRFITSVSQEYIQFWDKFSNPILKGKLSTAFTKIKSECVKIKFSFRVGMYNAFRPAYLHYKFTYID